MLARLALTVALASVPALAQAAEERVTSPSRA